MSNKVKLNITMRRPSSCNSCPFNKDGGYNEPNFCEIHPSKSVDIYKASTPKEGISDTCPLYATNIVDMVADVGEFGYYCFEVVGGKNDNSPSSKTCSNCEYCLFDDDFVYGYCHLQDGIDGVLPNPYEDIGRCDHYKPKESDN